MQSVIIHEVGLRDGLQIEQKTMPTETKLMWVKKLVKAGIKTIQLGSFVHPVKVPQMANTDELFKLVHNSDLNSQDIVFSGLVLNERGLDRGLACGVELFCMGVSASQTHSQKNTGMDTNEALKRIIAMAKQAQQHGIKVQLSVQSAFGCGFEGKIAKESVMNIVKTYLDSGFRFISLADTAGYAHPDQVQDYYTSIYELDSAIEGACHFHDTFGAGIANCYAAFQSGVRHFETAFGGLGGCPFTKTSSGNVCTEDLVYLFKRMGKSDLPDIEKLVTFVNGIAETLERDLSGRLYKTGFPEVLKGEH